MCFPKQRGYDRAAECVAFALAAILSLVACGIQPGEPGPTGTPIVPPAGKTPLVQGEVPQGTLDPILNEAAALANVAREQLVIVRAGPVIWNDGSLGCPEPGMM